MLLHLDVNTETEVDFDSGMKQYIQIDRQSYLLPFNIQQRSAQQSTIYARELSYYFLRIMSIFRGKLYYLRLATAALDINMEPLKENGILLSQFARNVVEVSF